MDEDILIPAMFFLTVIVLALGIPLVRAYVRRMNEVPLQPRMPADLDQRLERIEAIVETVAVEVERLAEGQRFTTRLLSEGALRESPGAARHPQPINVNTEVTHA